MVFIVVGIYSDINNVVIALLLAKTLFMCHPELVREGQMNNLETESGILSSRVERNAIEGSLHQYKNINRAVLTK